MPYLNTQEVEDRLEILSLSYPSLCQRIKLGNATYEGFTSHALSIRTGPVSPRMCIVLIGGVHACEWGSSDTLIFLAESLLVAYQNGTNIVLMGRAYTAAQVRDLLESLEILIFPLVNPDGRTYSQTVDEWWRKNRAPTPEAGTLGVDINRNYDFLWNFTQQFIPGRHPAFDEPSALTYHGTAPWSEQETRNVKELVDLRPYTRFFVDVHSYAELILYPWGDDSAQSTTPDQNFQNPAFDSMRGDTSDALYGEYMDAKDVARFQGIAQRMGYALRQVRGTTYTEGEEATTMYIVSGGSIDYMYSRHLTDRKKRKIDGFVIEWGLEYHPAYSEMTNIIQEVSAALIELCLVAQEVPLIEQAPDPLDFGLVRTGTTKTLQVTIRNIGSRDLEVMNIQVH